MKYSAYPVYKDSGVEWLGEIPKDWEVLHLRRVIRSFVDYRGATPEKVPDGIPLITARNIKNGVIDFSLSQEYIREEDYASWMVRGFPEVGDVLVTTEAPLGESAQILEENIALAQRIILLKAEKSRINNDYLKYYIASTAGKGELWSRATGSTAIGIKASHLRETLITVPPSISEQQAIASFLDRETAKIHALIAKKERLIELLQEKRTAIISHAVTKGLDPTVQMKDSGVEWLEEIPAHWEAKRLRFTIRNGTQNGLYKSKDYYDDKGTPIISMSEAFASPVTRVLAKDRVQLTDDEYRSYSLEKGDLLFARRSLVFEGSGKCSMVGELPEVHIFESSIIRVRPDITVVESLFALLSLNSVAGRFQILRITKQVTISGIDAPNLKDVVIPLPPQDEQLAIISFINRETAKIDALIAKIREGIEKLKEYRTALISAAVTGKIDVRNEVAS